MKKTIQKTIIIAILSLMTLGIPIAASADLANETFDIGKLLTVPGQKHYGSITEFIVDIINFILKLAAAVITGIIVFAGIRLIASMGDENAIQRGKDILINALLGLLIVLGAYSITVFVQFLLYK